MLVDSHFECREASSISREASSVSRKASSISRKASSISRVLSEGVNDWNVVPQDSDQCRSYMKEHRGIREAAPARLCSGASHLQKPLLVGGSLREHQKLEVGGSSSADGLGMRNGRVWALGRICYRHYYHLDMQPKTQSTTFLYSACLFATASSANAWTSPWMVEYGPQPDPGIIRRRRLHERSCGQDGKQTCLCEVWQRLVRDGR